MHIRESREIRTQGKYQDLKHILKGADLSTTMNSTTSFQGMLIQSVVNPLGIEFSVLEKFVVQVMNE